MKSKTIAATINSKVADWLLSIDDESLAEKAHNDIIVTGGCIASMFLQEPVNDYDVYFKSNETILLLAIFYAKKMIASGNFQVIPQVRLTFSNSVITDEKDNRQVWSVEEIEVKKVNFTKLVRVEIYVKSQGFAAETTDSEYKYFESQSPEETEKFFTEKTKRDESLPKYRPVFMSSNAITLSDKFQIVLRFSGEPKTIHESYDFVHATNYWTKEEGLVTNAEALESILARELIYRGSLYPLASIFRTRKFILRGWSCHIGNYLKMTLQLNEIDLFDLDVLEEQLTGVDAAYLHEVMNAVKTKRKDDKSFVFNSAYLCQIVDRLMGVKNGGTNKGESA
jgi:hypothetical protein